MKRMLLFVFSAMVLMVFECFVVMTDPPGKDRGVTPVTLPIPEGFPYMNMNPDNPTTAEGIDLGRRLFYDPMLDGEKKRTCAECHLPAESFTLKKENSLSHVNLVWNYTYLWKGNVDGTLEDIMRFEVDSFFRTDLARLNADRRYRKLFRKAFGVERITAREVAFALAQFERTIVSSNSRYDRYVRGEVTLTESEENGRKIYFTEKGDCFHCHGTILLTDNSFHNNGLDSLPAAGRSEITRSRHDRGKFKTPTLRNILLTPPYMHDGRFRTIEEVIDFYSVGVKWSPTVDPLMKKVRQGGVKLGEQEKRDLIAFLKTFTDSTVLTNPSFADPIAAK